MNEVGRKVVKNGEHYQGCAKQRRKEKFHMVSNQEIIDWMNEKSWAKDRCSVCRRNEWVLCETADLEIYSPLTPRDFAPTLSIIPLRCDNCGYIRFFDLEFVEKRINDKKKMFFNEGLTV